MPRRGENIYKRKDGRWEGRYIRGRTPAGKAEYGYVYAKSYAACREKRRRMEDALPQKPMLTGEMSVCQAAEFFLSERRGALKASTIGRYEYTIPRLCLAELRLRDIIICICRNVHLRQPFARLFRRNTCHSLHCSCPLGPAHNCHYALIFGTICCINEVGESLYVGFWVIVLHLLDGIFCGVLGTEGLLLSL